MKFLAYGWSSRRSLPALRDQVDAALAAARHTGWDGPAQLPAGVPRRLLGARRRRARRRPRAAAGDALRAVQRAAVGGARRAPRDPGQGADRQRLRRALVLGHGDLHAAGADVRRAGGRARRAAGGATRRSTVARARSAGAGPAGRGVSVAHDLRPGVLGLLAGGHGGVSHQRRHRRRHAPLPRGDRRRGVRARAPRSSCSSRPPGCGARSDTTTRRAAFASTASPGPTSTPRWPTTTSTRTSWRRATCARRRRSRRATRARGRGLGVDEEEIAAWRDAADAIVLPYDAGAGRDAAVGGLHALSALGLRGHARTRSYPLLLHYPYYLLYSSQVVKQADLVFALYVCGDCFSAEQRARDFEYYERITVRDSSLSACVQAIVAAEVGHVELAYDYLTETAFIDLRDLAFNTRDGDPPRRAGGLLARRRRRLRRHARSRRRCCSSRPRLPERLARMSFRLLHRGCRLQRHGRLRAGALRAARRRGLEVEHHGERVVLERTGSVQSLPIPPLAARPRPAQPPGREPPLGHARRSLHGL